MGLDFNNTLAPGVSVPRADTFLFTPKSLHGSQPQTSGGAYPPQVLGYTGHIAQAGGGSVCLVLSHPGNFFICFLLETLSFCEEKLFPKGLRIKSDIVLGKKIYSSCQNKSIALYEQFCTIPL